MCRQGMREIRGGSPPRKRLSASMDFESEHSVSGSEAVTEPRQNAPRKAAGDRSRATWASTGRGFEPYLDLSPFLVVNASPAVTLSPGHPLPRLPPEQVGPPVQRGSREHERARRPDSRTFGTVPTRFFGSKLCTWSPLRAGIEGLGGGTGHKCRAGR